MAAPSPAQRIDAAIESGRYRLQAPGLDIPGMPLASRRDLLLTVRIPALDRMAEVDLAPVFSHFLDSGRERGNYTEEASITIEKFGAPLQFKETIHVEFSRS